MVYIVVKCVPLFLEKNMFRAAKNILFIIITGISFLLLSVVMKEYDENSIPNCPTSVVIDSWNHQQKKAVIFSTMEQMATKNKFQLTLVRTTNLNGKISKTSYNFSPAQKQPLSLYRNSHAQEITNRQLQLQEVKGTYYTNASGANLNLLQDKLRKLGVTTHIYKISLLKIVVNTESISSYLTIFLSIIGILAIVMFIEKIAKFKTYAILQLNGWSFKKILNKDIKANLLVFSLSFLALLVSYFIYTIISINLTSVLFIIKYAFSLLIIITVLFAFLDLFSYLSLALIDIYQAIQGKAYTKPFIIIGYVLKIVIVLIVITNTFLLKVNFDRYNQDQKIMQMWLKHRSGYVLQFGHVDDKDDKEVNRLGKSTRQLIAYSPDVIISKNNQAFQPEINDIDPANGNVLVVNGNYLKYNKIIKSSNKWVKRTNLKQNTFNVLVPDTRKYQTNKFIKSLYSYIKFQDTLPSLYRKNKTFKINILNYKGNQKVFNYTIGNEISNSISQDPMIVIVNQKQLSNDFYWATATQGLVQFQNLKKLQGNIKKVGLSNNIVGITDAKARLSDFNLKQIRRLLLMTLTVILSFTQLLIVISFISLTFLQKQRPKLAILKIFGQSNLKVMGQFLSLNVLGDLVLFLWFTLINHLSWTSVIYLLPYLLIELVVILVLAKHAEKDLLTTINQGN